MRLSGSVSCAFRALKKKKIESCEMDCLRTAPEWRTRCGVSASEALQHHFPSKGTIMERNSIGM